MNPRKGCRRASAILLAAALWLPTPVPAELDSAGPVRPSGGPLSEISGSVRQGSGPVHESGRSVRSAGPLSGNSVSGANVGPLRSGSVSDHSMGAVTDRSAPRAALMVGPALPEDAETAPPFAAPAGSLQSLAERLRQIEPLPADEEATLSADASEAEDDASDDDDVTDALTPDEEQGATVDDSVEPVDDEEPAAVEPPSAAADEP